MKETMKAKGKEEDNEVIGAEIYEQTEVNEYKGEEHISK